MSDEQAALFHGLMDQVGGVLKQFAVKHGDNLLTFKRSMDYRVAPWRATIIKADECMHLLRRRITDPDIEINVPGTCVFMSAYALIALALYEERTEDPQEPTVCKALRHVDEAHRTHDRKRQDYGSDEDNFANVRGSESFGVVAWVGALIRANDKLVRMQSMIRNKRLENESLEDSMMDLAVYSIISAALYQEMTG